MMKSNWVLAGVVAVMAFAAASSAFAGGGKHGGRRGGAKHADRQGAQVQKAAHPKHRRVADFLASLNPTDEQRALVLEKARAAAPIVASARDEARKIVARAWASASKDATTDRKAVRASVKTEIQALRAKAFTQIEPLAREVVASLTPEQRQKFEAASSKRGKSLDDAKLTRFAARLISRPMTVPFLEARKAK